MGGVRLTGGLAAPLGVGGYFNTGVALPGEAARFALDRARAIAECRRRAFDAVAGSVCQFEVVGMARWKRVHWPYRAGPERGTQLGHERRRCSAAAERCALLQRCHRRRLPPPHTKEDLKMKRIAALLGALALFAMTAPAVVAAPGPTGDEGLIGAKNMANSNALPGMQNAMSV